MMAAARKFLFLALASAAVCVLLYFIVRPSQQVTASEIESELRTNVPPGTDRANVEGFLDRKGIEHRYIEKNLNDPKFDRTEWARIPSTSKGFAPVRTDFQILFKFDEAGRLIDLSVAPSLVGP